MHVYLTDCILVKVTMTIKQTLPIIAIEHATENCALTKKAVSIDFPLSEKDHKLIDYMKQTLFSFEGVGLAAPQLNQEKNIIAVYIPNSAALLRNTTETYPMHILINAIYEGIEEEGFSRDFESCYSVTSKAGKINRYKSITISYQDESGQKHTSIEKGFYARVLQHEIDHVNGLLITDRLTSICPQGTLSEMMALRRQELPDSQKPLFDDLISKKTILYTDHQPD